MSLDLPTEEDVLAHLVLFAAKPVVTNTCSSGQIAERTAWNAATGWLDVFPNPVSVLALRRLREAGTIEAAIADSERRLALEEARNAVVEAARAWGESIFAGVRGEPGDVLSAVCLLESAEMGLRALEGK